jgi:hypothetical protein
MNLQEQKTQLEASKQTLEQNYYQQSESATKQLSETVLSFFQRQGVLTEQDIVKGGGYSFSIQRPHSESNYPKEMFTLYHDNAFREDTYKLKINYYTGGSIGSDSPWELTRLATIGRVASILLNKELESELNILLTTIKVAFEPITKEYYKSKGEINQELSLVNQELNRQAEVQFLADLTKGVTFQDTQTLNQSTRTYYKVRGLKLIKATSSGKSVDVMLRDDWSERNYQERFKIENLIHLKNQPYTVS